MNKPTAEHTLIAHHDEKATFGFWLYIMSDCLLFASLFATYAVLHNATFGAPSSKELFSLPFVLLETMILLTSSFTVGLAVLYARAENMRLTLSFLVITLLLGLAFLFLEIREFHMFILEGASFTKSAFLSAFFTLVGTHGLHVALGSLFMLVLILMLALRGFGEAMMRRLVCLSVFWHFLDIIWIFIFTIVYLMGTL
jgi:cytochrome o ubiquinol oxidase subunit 3